MAHMTPTLLKIYFFLPLPDLIVERGLEEDVLWKRNDSIMRGEKIKSSRPHRKVEQVFFAVALVLLLVKDASAAAVATSGRGGRPGRSGDEPVHGASAPAVTAVVRVAGGLAEGHVGPFLRERRRDVDERSRRALDFLHEGESGCFACATREK